MQERKSERITKEEGRKRTERRKLIFYTSFIPCKKFRLPYLSQAKAAATAVLPVPNGACGIFVCPNKGMATNAWDFLTCAQMLMHVIAYGGCTDTVRESALKADSGRKTSC